jgi:hypothetical protein
VFSVIDFYLIVARAQSGKNKAKTAMSTSARSHTLSSADERLTKTEGLALGKESLKSVNCLTCIMSFLGAARSEELHTRARKGEGKVDEELVVAHQVLDHMVDWQHHELIILHLEHMVDRQYHELIVLQSEHADL